MEKDIIYKTFADSFIIFLTRSKNLLFFLIRNIFFLFYYLYENFINIYNRRNTNIAKKEKILLKSVDEKSSLNSS